jgi:hypothetical protein
MGRLLVVAASIAGCSSGGRENASLTLGTGITAVNGGTADDGDADGDADGDGDSTSADDPSDGGPKLDISQPNTGGAEGGDGGECPCENVQDGIYVLHSPGLGQPSVYFFDPPANTFTPVGQLGCPAPLQWTANSMAIDRAGNAWVNYYDLLSQTGKLYRAPLSDTTQCVEVPYTQPVAGGWFLLGMGYATVTEASSCDELFVYKSDRYQEYPNFGPGGAELAEYDEAAGTLDIIGPTDYPVGELTGTGDARLFAFGPVDDQLAVLVHLDKNSGAELEHTDLDGLDITNAFAFAFWGGDVYFFTETAPMSGVSKVTRLDYDNNAGGGLAVYNADTGIHIPGAGVSTCASFEPPG